MPAMRTEREQQVVEAAYGVFFHYGYARTTMADLASAAKLSRPALYLVYPGKAEVFDAVLEWTSENTLAAIEASLKEEWSLARKLQHFLELSIAKGYDEVRANPDAADLLSLGHEVPAVERTYAKLQSYLTRLLDGAVQESALKASPEDLARALLSAVRGFKVVAKDGKDLRHLITTQVSVTAAALGQVDAIQAVRARARKASPRQPRSSA
jgi:AcrR family transcriptional regulator